VRLATPARIARRRGLEAEDVDGASPFRALLPSLGIPNMMFASSVEQGTSMTTIMFGFALRQSASYIDPMKRMQDGRRRSSTIAPVAQDRRALCRRRAIS
jgi:hypothetical protein